MKTRTSTNGDNIDSQISQPGFTHLSSDSESRRDRDVDCELRLILDIAAAQIDLAMRDSDPAVAVLTDAFSHIADRSESMAAGVEIIRDEAPGVAGQRLIDFCTELSESTQSAVVALQFYDRLTQRLRHVKDNLEMLATLPGEKYRLDSPEQWERLKRAVRNGYTGETEKALYDAIMDSGIAADELNQISGPGNGELPGAVELF